MMIKVDLEGNVGLKSLLDSFKVLKNSEDVHMISYYSEEYDVFVYAGTYKKLKIEKIPLTALGDTV